MTRGRISKSGTTTLTRSLQRRENLQDGELQLQVATSDHSDSYGIFIDYTGKGLTWPKLGSFWVLLIFSLNSRDPLSSYTVRRLLTSSS